MKPSHKVGIGSGALIALLTAALEAWSVHQRNYVSAENGRINTCMIQVCERTGHRWYKGTCEGGDDELLDACNGR